MTDQSWKPPRSFFSSSTMHDGVQCLVSDNQLYIPFHDGILWDNDIDYNQSNYTFEQYFKMANSLCSPLDSIMGSWWFQTRPLSSLLSPGRLDAAMEYCLPLLCAIYAPSDSYLYFFFIQSHTVLFLFYNDLFFTTEMAFLWHRVVTNNSK